ncbi:hypothetical protein VKT23_018019 [Stygiomarasmius scandens]|uniref:Transmembrane protein n=1 Tax=Marasmiellus scandens TaxID=2682957 RepID=A0ABR1IT82_9AGAR
MHLFVLIPLVMLGRGFCALVNVTVDETSPQITYHGNSWVKNEAGPLYHGGFHDQTEDLNASAVFNFTGVAIYYYSSLWPFNVSTVLTLDGNDTETLNLTAITSPQDPNGDPVAENSTIRWSRTHLKDGPHSLIISPGNFVLVDAFIYTTNQSEVPDTHSSSSLQNVTVEETSSQIIYNGDNWIKNQANPLYHGGTQSQNQDVTANAVFTFTGNAVYYYASLWPFRVTTVLSLDGEPGDTVDLTDPSVPNQETSPPTVQSAIRWSRTNLTEGNHTLTISTGNYAMVDAIVYTKDLSAPTNSSKQSPSPNSTTTNASEPTSAASTSPQSKIGLIVGVVGGVLGFLLITAIVLIIFLYRRLKHQPKGQQKPPEQTTAQHQHTAVTTERQGFGRVSPYIITVPPEVSVGTMGSDEANFGDASSPTTTIRTQTTRKGGYISSLASLPGLRGNATQWDAPPPSYRG